MKQPHKLSKKEKLNSPKQKNSSTDGKLESRKLQSAKWILLGVIVLIIFISFIPALKNDYTNWDDNVYVKDNIALSKPIIEGIKYFFGLHYFVGNYTPVTMITYALEYHLAGVSPGLYHAVNVLIHLLNVMLVFWFIYLLSGKKLEVAAIVSIFFGIHPMHVESVAWIAELKDVLYTFFFIGGLIAYYKYIQQQKIKDEKSRRINSLLVLTFILFVLSILSKPAAVVFPLVLLLIDYYAGRNNNLKSNIKQLKLLEKLPFFLISLIFGIITIKAQQAHAIHLTYSIFQTVLFASYSLLGYMIKFFLPINLSAFYPYPVLVNGHLPFIFYVSPIIIIVLIFLLWRAAKLNYSTFKLILFGLLFFFINIALVLQVLTFGGTIMADRYTYIPYIGLLFIIAMVFSKLYKNPKLRKLLIVICSLFIIICSLLTYTRCQIWKNDETLWKDVLNKTPFVPEALFNEGVALYNREQYNKAIKLYTEAIQLKPDYVDAYMNLASCFIETHDYNNELKNLDLALKYDPSNYKAMNAKGIIFFNTNKYEDAMQLFKKTIELNPRFDLAYMNIGSCYGIKQDYDNAIFYLKKSLEFNPDNADAYNMLAMGYQKKGDTVSANIYFAKAKELKNK